MKTIINSFVKWVKSFHYKKSFDINGIEKEIITCGHCGQKLRVPRDRKRYTDITCTNCRRNPFLDIISKLKKVWRQYKIILIIVFVVIIYTYVFSFQDNSVNVYPALPIETHTNTITTPINNIVIPTNIIVLSNGEFIIKNSYYLNGSGELEISNGTSNNAVAKLVNINTNKSIATFYIGANNKYTLKNITNGNYKLVFNLGHDWDTISKKFIRNSSYSVFEEDFNFTTRIVSDGEYYSTYRVTLNPVLNGNAETNDINSEEFTNY